MINASLYSINPVPAIVDAGYFMDNYGKWLNWQDNENILDAGSGGGNVTLNVLVPRIPKPFKKLLGLDIDSEMVEIANGRNKNSKIDFAVMDLCAPVVPKQFQESFDHIFSFYLMHFVEDQRALFSNLYKMLKPGGEVFLTCMSSYPTYEVFDNLSKNKKWASYHTNYKKYVTEYRTSTHPLADLINYLKGAGFVCRFCKMEDLVTNFQEMSSFKNLMVSLNTNIKEIPKDKLDVYIDDFINEHRNVKNVRFYNGPDGKEMIDYGHSCMVAIATKPL